MPPAIPFTSQVKAAPAATQNEARKICVAVSVRVALVGEIDASAVHTIVTLADAVSEIPEAAAVMVTVEGEGGIAGAV